MPPLVAESPLLGSGGNEATAPTVALPQITPPPMLRDVPRAPAPIAAEEEPRAVATPRDEPPPARSNVGSIIGIFLVLLVVGGIVAYVKLMGGGAAAKVAVVVASPREVVRLYEGAAAVKKSDGQTLTFGESGKVSDAVAAGTEVKTGMALVVLDSYAKIEKELADVKDRLAFYEKQLSGSKAKGDDEAAKNAEAKVVEKKKLLTELEARAPPSRMGRALRPVPQPSSNTRAPAQTRTASPSASSAIATSGLSTAS